MEQTLIAQVSNALHAIFLCGMIVAAFFRLTDGRREEFAERIGLWLVGFGAFCQLVKAAHPSGTSFEVLLTNAGVLVWMTSQLYVLYKKVKS